MATLSIKQRIMRRLYPLIMRLSRRTNNGKVLRNEAAKPPQQSLYNLNVTLNNGQPLSLQNFKGKKMLLVNTASACGYTSQYSELQQLSEQYGDKLAVIGFPANDFKEQEKGSDKDIAQFCQVNFGVQFPLAKKSSVVKSPQQNPVFAWLTHPQQNGWNEQAPSWNFSKYLIDENGTLSHYFGPAVSPLSKEVIDAVAQSNTLK